MADGDGHYVGTVTQKAVLFGPDGDVLVTRADGQWQSPGGTFEYGETLVGGVRRELREELGVESRVGPPVEAVYGGWVDEATGNPMVTLVYRCETDERGVSLNDEHDEFEWVASAEAAGRLGEVSGRLRRAVERAAGLDPGGPFEAVTDPYADAAASRGAVLDELAARRAADGLHPDREERYCDRWRPRTDRQLRARTRRAVARTRWSSPPGRRRPPPLRVRRGGAPGRAPR